MRYLIALAAALSLAASPVRQEADLPVAEMAWPKRIEAEQADIVMYQPQPERFSGDQLSGRAAVSVTPKGGEPVFGAVWLTTRVEVDTDEREVLIRSLRVPRVRFPDATLEQEAWLADLIESEVPDWDLRISLDRLSASLESAEREEIASRDLSTAPPDIVVTDVATVLVTIDGEPRMKQIAGSKLMRVENTVYLVVFESAARTYWLYAGVDAWYRAPELAGDWKLTSEVPEHVAALTPKEPAGEASAGDPDEEADPDAPPPRVLVATAPTELVVIEGETELTPLPGGELMYVSNTDSDLFLELDSQAYFLLLSGRWYRADELQGPWDYVAADALPAAFAAIPADSDVGDVRTFVPGTEEAQDAVLDAQIPQTAAVQRDAAGIEVEYDGAPKFEPIPGTELAYAVNTATTVLRAGDAYYACAEAVWYVATTPMGPWKVATERPPGVDDLPPESPVYNVKYVYVYEVTPTVVYVGYTPGYTCTYVYGGTIVYGTGYHYPCWYGAYYYPRPATWGFHVRWNPWTGWSFGVSVSNGRFTFGIGFGSWGRWGGGCWGPAGFRGYARGYHRGYYHGARAGYRAGYRAGASAGTLPANVYQKGRAPGVQPTRANRPATVQAGAGGRPTPSRQPSVAPGTRRDLYADRDGGVHERRADGGFDTLSRPRDSGAGAGDRARPATRPSTTPSRPTPSQGSSHSLQRDSHARDRGTTRANDYQRSRAGGGARGGARGGGGRRGR